MSADTLIVFAKAPVEGKVKTRLIPELGSELALRAHIEMVRLTLDKARGSGLPSTLWLSEQNKVAAEWANQHSMPVRVQSGDDLGCRMLNAITRTLSDDYDKVILIGSDCPSLRVSDIQAACDALDKHDVVLNPCEDGGYGLIGMSESHLEIFSGIAWSTSEVLSQTLANIERIKLSVWLGRTIWDVDDVEDWKRYQKSKGKALY